jgi:NADH-quinone oxidoreductase subunit M
MSYLLPWLILIPVLAGIVIVAIALRGGQQLASRAAQAVSILLLVASCWVAMSYAIEGPAGVSASAEAAGGATIQPLWVFQPSWLSARLPSGSSLAPSLWNFSLGLDGIGGLMLLLSSLVTCVAILIGKDQVGQSHGLMGGWLLIASGAMAMVFLAMDLLTFYIGFELALIPLFALVAGWGTDRKESFTAARRFVLFTLAGSIPMVLGLLALASLGGGASWTWDFVRLSSAAAAPSGLAGRVSESWAFWLLLWGLGIKMAILPLHAWLPPTYRACHPVGTAFLGAVAVKMGLFGFLRLLLPMLPQACIQYGPWVLGSLGAAAILYGAFAALGQKDLRTLLAYSSLSHVGFIMLGLFSLTSEGLAGGVLQMFHHGLTTAAMFLLVGAIGARIGTYDWQDATGGLAGRWPHLAAFFVFFTMAGAGMPGLNHFVGELLSLLGMARVAPWLSAVGCAGVLLGAWYALRMVHRLFFGTSSSEKPPRKGADAAAVVTGDLGWRPILVFSFMAAVALYGGLVPSHWLQLFRADTDRIAQQLYQRNGAAASARRLSEASIESPQLHGPTLVTRRFLSEHDGQALNVGQTPTTLHLLP